MADSNDLNKHAGLVLWFDDLGSGNEEFRFLSNFYEGTPFTVPGWTWEALFEACGVPVPINKGAKTGPIEWRTGEHAFAAMKFWGTDWTHFADIVNADGYTYIDRRGHEQHVSAPSEAKALGRSRKHPLREDWEVVKLDVMAAVTRAKYAFGRPEAEALVKRTDDRLLVEGTWWGDEVWGVALDTEGAPGRNWLGTLLMARRAELRMIERYGLEASDLAMHFLSDTVNHNADFSV